MANERDFLSGSLVESLLTAMAYAGDEAAAILATVTPEMFDGPIYQDVASRIIEYRNRYRKPPAPAHLDDIFAHILDDQNHKHYRSYNRIFVGMRELAPSLNVKFLVDQIVSFARRSRLKDGVLQAAERYQQGGEGLEDDVEKILSDTIRYRVETIDYGERLSDNPLDFMNYDEVEEGSQVRTGIERLDRLGLVLTRGELYAVMGAKGSGKSWWLQYLLRKAVRQRWNCVHVTLENRARNVKQRYVQSWLGVAKRKEPYILAELRKDAKGNLDDINYEVLTPMLSLDDPKDRRELDKRAARWNMEFGRIIIKEWPSGFLTVPQLDHWLDGLAESEGFVPDAVVVDMPQLMKLDPKDLRGSFGRTTVELRGLAGRRNLAMGVALHSNRAGERAGVLRTDHVAEDISQFGTADTVVSYNQTDPERRLGLARIFVAKARNDLGKFSILISQAYATGQFHLDSVAMRGDTYSDMLEEAALAVGREDLGQGTEAGSYDDTELPEAADD